MSEETSSMIGRIINPVTGQSSAVGTFRTFETRTLVELLGEVIAPPWGIRNAAPLHAAVQLDEVCEAIPAEPNQQALFEVHLPTPS
ncbi:hypothetical protein BH23GEM6_BH23GEM6_25010 [soil metagenome]